MYTVAATLTGSNVAVIPPKNATALDVANQGEGRARAALNRQTASTQSMTLSHNPCRKTALLACMLPNIESSVQSRNATSPAKRRDGAPRVDLGATMT